MLTTRQREILTRMAADPDGESGELVYERGSGLCAPSGYLDLDLVAPRTIFALLRVCAITCDSDGAALERYHINETGRELLADEVAALEKLRKLGLL